MKYIKRPPVFCRGMDVVILAGLLLCSILFALLPLRTKGSQAVIAKGNVVLAVVDLAQTQTQLQIKGAEGFVFCIADNRIAVAEAPCEAQICCKSHSIGAQGQSIVCLPCQLTVTVTDGSSDSLPLPDAVIG